MGYDDECVCGFVGNENVWIPLDGRERTRCTKKRFKISEVRHDNEKKVLSQNQRALRNAPKAAKRMEVLND